MSSNHHLVRFAVKALLLALCLELFSRLVLFAFPVQENKMQFHRILSVIAIVGVKAGCGQRNRE